MKMNYEGYEGYPSTLSRGGGAYFYCMTVYCFVLHSERTYSTNGTVAAAVALEA